MEEALLMSAENGVDLIEAVIEKEIRTFEEMAAGKSSKHGLGNQRAALLRM